MQTINRNNYEELFLLYVDDEMDADSKLAVENFVEQNPDLAIELEMLLQTKYVVDEPVSFDKESLLRTEGNSINEGNHEEYFLLYIDNELSVSKREEVEMYVLQHPKLQDEFTTLKQAVLATEIISYGDKKDLYRTEKRRTFYLKPWRLAAAAIFVGVCAVGFWLMQKPATAVTVAGNPSVKNQSQQNVAVTKPTDSMQQNIKLPDEIMQQPEQNIAQQSSTKENKKVVVKSKKEISGNNAAIKNNNNEESQVVIQHSPGSHDNIGKEQKEPPVENDVAVVPQHIAKQNDVAVLQTIPGNSDQSQGNYDVYPVAYKELNTNDDDNSLHVGMLDLNKTKVKTFFKKAGRMFGNKSSDLANENGKLQIANFEIDTKKQ